MLKYSILEEKKLNWFFLALKIYCPGIIKSFFKVTGQKSIHTNTSIAKIHKCSDRQKLTLHRQKLPRTKTHMDKALFVWVFVHVHAFVGINFYLWERLFVWAFVSMSFHQCELSSIFVILFMWTFVLWAFACGLL